MIGDHIAPQTAVDGGWQAARDEDENYVFAIALQSRLAWPAKPIPEEPATIGLCHRQKFVDSVQHELGG